MGFDFSINKWLATYWLHIQLVGYFLDRYVTLSRKYQTLPISFWPKENNITCGLKNLDRNKQRIYFDRFHSGALRSKVHTFQNVVIGVTSKVRQAPINFHFVVSL